MMRFNIRLMRGTQPSSRYGKVQTKYPRQGAVRDYPIQVEGYQKRGKKFKRQSSGKPQMHFQQARITKGSQQKGSEILKTSKYIGKIDEMLSHVRKASEDYQQKYSKIDISEQQYTFYGLKRKYEEVGSGSFCAGKVESKVRISRDKNPNFQDVQVIFLCQCGKKYVTYMGIYRHIRTKHLKKNEIKAFQTIIYKDRQKKQTIKKVILSNYIQRSTIEPVRQKTKQKLDQSKKQEQFCEVNKQSVRFQQAQKSLQKLKSQRCQKTINSQTEISLGKYEKVLDDYRDLIDKFFCYQQRSSEKEEKTREQISRLHKIKQKYKSKVKMLKEKLKNTVQANEETSQFPCSEGINQSSEIHNNDTKIEHYQSSRQEGQSCSTQSLEQIHKLKQFYSNVSASQTSSFCSLITEGTNQNRKIQKLRVSQRQGSGKFIDSDIDLRSDQQIDQSEELSNNGSSNSSEKGINHVQNKQKRSHLRASTVTQYYLEGGEIKEQSIKTADCLN